MKSPYVGPGPFDQEHTLFGRDAELEELQWRLIADRIIVLYSPSGAGKTSLLMAKNGLIAGVSDRFYAITGLRVGNSAVTDLSHNLLLQLASHGDTPVTEQDTLESYVERLPIPEGESGKRLLLVFDQFEEVFTCGASEEQRLDLFKQLGALLSLERSPSDPLSSMPKRSVWVVISMREEYFSWLDPFRDLIPTRLNHTFRLPMLGIEQAIEAVRQPAMAEGVEFPCESGEDAASLLVKRLGTKQIRTPDGRHICRESGTVEPVHIQVIWADLWQRLSDHGKQPVTRIEVGDVREYPLGTPLQDYCDKALDAAADDKQRGKYLRDWVDRRLLTLDGLRVARRIELEDDSAPRREELARLEAVHIIRQYSRDDGQWYELAHDRLASPIRRSIEAWRQANLAAWQLLARAWHRDGERPGFFKSLSGASQRNIPKDATGQDYSQLEVRFIETYRREKRHRNTRNSIALLCLLAVTGFAWNHFEQERNLLAARGTNASQLALLSILGRDPAPDLGNLAALMGMQLQEAHPEWLSVNFQRLLGDQLSRARGIERIVLPGAGPTRKIAQNDRFLIIADIGEGRHSVEVLDLAQEQPPQPLDTVELKAAHPLGISAISMAGDQYFLTADYAGAVSAWDSATRQRVMTLHTKVGDSAIKAMAWMEGKLFLGHNNGVVDIWQVDVSTQSEKWLDDTKVHSRVTDLSPFDHGNAVAITDISDLDAVTLLRFNGGRKNKTTLQPEVKEEGYYRAYYSVAVSTDERLIAASNRAGRVQIWKTSNNKGTVSFNAHDRAVAQMRYLDDGSLLTAGWDGLLKRWTFTKEGELIGGEVLNSFAYQLAGLTLAPDQQQVHVSSERGDVVRISVNLDRHPIGMQLKGTSSAFGLVQNPDNPGLMTAMSNGLSRFHLNEDGSVKQTDFWQTPAVRGIARAEVAGVQFVATQNDIFLIRDQDSSDTLPTKVFTADTPIEWIRSEENGRLLIVKSSNALKLLAFDKGYQRGCPVNFAPMPPEPIKLATFRPRSSDLVITQKNTAQIWRFSGINDDCNSVRLTQTGYAIPSGLGDILTLGFSPSGQHLWLGTFTGQIYAVDLQDPATGTTLLEGTSTLEPSALTASNDTLVVGDTMGRLYLYLPDNAGQQGTSKRLSLPLLINQHFHTSTIRSLDISDDGRWLVSSSDTGTAIWDLRLETWKRKACELAGKRSFSDDEKVRYFKYTPVPPNPCITSL
ncbi:WD40 repeat domain-containing protein [uncultured Pseudomonas sp.]|uniref:nSTAND1 domain-containing NTPase n=1 Tax=uncultured Pseudomonas sp. TaxID=114707 RepID=UPI0025EAE83D|nr:WD40 repeat domain-containing protein [uncultured Pseudomonas sp.]